MNKKTEWLDQIGYHIIFWLAAAAIVADAFGWEPDAQLVRTAAFFALAISARASIGRRLHLERSEGKSSPEPSTPR